MTSSAPRVPRDRSSWAAPSKAPTVIPAWAEAIVRLLDRAFVIPGTKIPIGLDAILGFVAPGAGDAASALATASLFWVAHQARVPKVILLRMLINVAVDAIVGAIPFVGDLFDVAFRAGDKNLALIRKHAAQGAAPGVGDYAILALALLCVLALFALPVLLGLALFHAVAELTAG